MFIYNSVNQFVNYIASVAGQKSRYDGSQDGREDFYGTQTLSEAINLFEKGYNKPLESLKKFAINCNNIYNNKFFVVNDYKGSRPNIGRYLRGLPRQMKRYKKEQTNNNNLSLFVDVAVACNVKFNDKLRWGEKILSIINTLQNNGVNIELYIGVISGSKRDSTQPSENLAIKIKSFSEPINILALCFPICHNAFFRRFDEIHYNATNKSLQSWGTNYPAYNTNIDCQKFIEDNLSKNSIYISYKNVDEVVKKIEQK